MILKDANALKADFTGNFTECYPTALVKAMIDDAPTVDAIPVEQVARILRNYVDECPRYYGISEKMDLWCHEHSCVDKFYGEYNCCVDEYKCWLHALNEGWLDDGT